MAEPTRRRLVAALAATTLVALLTVAPGLAGASAVDWAGSKFDTPTLSDMNASGTRGKATVTSESFPISGRFHRTQDGDPTRSITSVGVAFNRATADGTAVAREPTEPCLPVDSPPAGNSGTRATFEVGASQSTWPCNGRYVVTATARSSGAGGPDAFELFAELTVAVRPDPVTVIDAQVDDDADRVTITWDKLTESQLAVDAIGYRVERAGPADRDGVYGFYRPIADDVSEDRAGGQGTVTDTVEADGKYRYRVLSMRNGADGPIFASSEGTATANATLTPSPGKPTTTTTTEPGSTPASTGVPRIGTGRTLPTIPNRPGAPLPAPPNTIDPGFDPELDYDGNGPRSSDSPELAGEEGLSFIENEPGDGPGLVGPVAGALVLLGWAGHIVYLNRLAKQF